VPNTALDAYGLRIRDWSNYFHSSDALAAEQGLSSHELKAFVGLREPEAKARAATLGLTLRVVERDGERLTLQDNLAAKRINASLRAGVVEEIVGVG
jgi:hypothetical protein